MGGGHAAAAGIRTLEIVVTSEGFVPAILAARRGETLRLVVTRKTGQTCAEDFVIEEYGIRRALPLDRATAIELTPTSPGEILFACGSSKTTGIVIVR